MSRLRKPARVLALTVAAGLLTLSIGSHCLVAEIRDAMTTAGLSQRQLADETGIPLPTLSRRLRCVGQAFFYPELASIAQVLGVTGHELVERAEQRYEASVGVAR